MRLLVLLTLLPGMMTTVMTTAWGSQGNPNVDEILRRALGRALWYEEEKIEARFLAEVVQVSEKLGKRGQVEEREERVSRIEPLDEAPGHTFERLLTKNGLPLSAQEQQEEEKRRKRFVEDIRRGRNPEDPERQRVFFDEKLVSRYDFVLDGIVPDENRSSFVLHFRPKNGKLPEETRFDKALNKAQGEMWIDTENYEISKVHFNLMESIGIWWGMIGSISQLEGWVDRKPVTEDVWMPGRLEFYINGRIFFMSLHRRETKDWSSFRPWRGSTEARLENPTPAPLATD